MAAAATPSAFAVCLWPQLHPVAFFATQNTDWRWRRATTQRPRVLSVTPRPSRADVQTGHASGRASIIVVVEPGQRMDPAWSALPLQRLRHPRPPQLVAPAWRRMCTRCLILQRRLSARMKTSLRIPERGRGFSEVLSTSNFHKFRSHSITGFSFYFFIVGFSSCCVFFKIQRIVSQVDNFRFLFSDVII